MRTLTTFISFFLLLALVILPGITLAADTGLVPTCGFGCGYDDFIHLLNNIMIFIIELSVPVSILLFVYAGFLYLTGQEAKVKKAKEIFWSVVVGIIIMLISWLVVYTVLNLLLSPTYQSKLPLKSR